MNNKRFCVTLALLAVAVGAQAAPVTVDFAVTSTNDSPNYPAGINGSGWFSFDDGLVPAGGTGVLSDTVAGLPTLDLSFSGSSEEVTHIPFAAARLMTASSEQRAAPRISGRRLPQPMPR